MSEIEYLAQDFQSIGRINREPKLPANIIKLSETEIPSILEAKIAAYTAEQLQQGNIECERLSKEKKKNKENWENRLSRLRDYENICASEIYENTDFLRSHILKLQKENKAQKAELKALREEIGYE